MEELDLLKRLEEEYGFLWTNIKLELYKMIHKVVFDCGSGFWSSVYWIFGLDLIGLVFNSDDYCKK
jgi:hypothetical protein